MSSNKKRNERTMYSVRSRPQDSIRTVIVGSLKEFGEEVFAVIGRPDADGRKVMADIMEGRKPVDAHPQSVYSEDGDRRAVISSVIFVD